MEAARHLRAVSDGPNFREIARGVRKGELVVMDPETGEPVSTAADTIVGLFKTIEGQGRTIGSLERQVTESGDVTTHPKGKEIVALIERWKAATGHPKAAVGQARVKMVKARLKDGYTIADLELAVDGLGAYPYRSYDRRMPTGKPSQREDDLSFALKDEKHVERAANLGHEARKRGWTLENGWPNE